MKNLVIVALVAAGVFFAWDHFHSASPAAPAASSPNTTPGANAKNRVDGLSGLGAAEAMP